MPGLGPSGAELGKGPTAGGAGGYGSDTVIPVNGVNAREDVTATTGAPGSEFGSYLIKLIENGALLGGEIYKLAWAGVDDARLFLGNPAHSTGLRTFLNTTIQLWLNGAAPLDVSNAGAQWGTRVNETLANATVTVNTLTLGNAANLLVVPGTPTIQGITIGSNTRGHSARILCAPGTTIVNASGAPGAGAASILTPTAANIVTGGTQSRVIPVSYDGTNWYVDG